MEELINNIKENVKININGKDYIVKTKTLYGIEEDEDAYYYKCILNTGDTLVIIPDDDLIYIGKEIENLKFRRPEESVLFYNENLFVKVGDGNQFIKNIEFGTGIEEKCIFEIISLGYLPDEERRADILADIIDIKNIKVVKE